MKLRIALYTALFLALLGTAAASAQQRQELAPAETPALTTADEPTTDALADTPEREPADDSFEAFSRAARACAAECGDEVTDDELRTQFQDFNGTFSEVEFDCAECPRRNIR